MVVKAPTTAVVLGGSLAGLLAASVLTEHVDSVTVIERDRFPDGPLPRKGVPQAHHGHLLLSGGVATLEKLLPGLTARLLDRGARRLGVPNDVVSLTPQGWTPRFPEMQYALCCDRALLDHTVREQVLANDRITVVEATDVERLCGSADRVTGVLVRDRDGKLSRTVSADLVVDATGRGSSAPRWLVELGLPAVREDVVDPGLAYATRRYRAPAGAPKNFPTVSIQGDPGTGRPARAAVIFPIEDDQWLVTLSGTRGAEPPTDDDGFERYAAALPHPMISELMAAGQPLGAVRGYRNNANRRRRFERLPRWPAGFFVVGDAVAITNPTYGHGMSVAAAGIAALRAGLAEHGFAPADGRRIQREIARAGDASWLMATGQDSIYPGAAGPGRTRAARVQKRFADRLQRVANQDPRVLAELIRGHTLSGSLAGLLTPRVLYSLLRGAPARPIGDAPFTPAELAVLTTHDDMMGRERA